MCLLFMLIFGSEFHVYMSPLYHNFWQIPQIGFYSSQTLWSMQSSVAYGMWNFV